MTVGANTRSYADSGRSPNTTYYYRVRAYNTAGFSSYSNVSSATTLNVPPAAPGGLVARSVSSSEIDLTWTDYSSNETSFKVERSLDGSLWTEIASVNANASTYSSTSLTASTTCYFRVRAFNSGGYSAYSNVDSARTKRR